MNPIQRLLRALDRFLERVAEGQARLRQMQVVRNKPLKSEEKATT